ncbi:hypothetical protein BA950_10965 [Erythrobacter sp. SAORIC-644]|nr:MULTISPECIES: PilZ domain-containing protein [Erythrobacteraceae]MAB43885.1 hypothetical protein [Sphingomonadaceae bacterium]MDB2694482.1 PilZ domain-containing protein [Erythrobacter sp.]MEC7953205.1 PilZ domain-containing protein [Pseudomonadota bacterium]PHR05445.1 MAG: hypothetical protein COB31_01100 [Erythrobacter sp.]PNQ75726.1 hypothetical protein BA950_10965 [Erythrobacter sp. SAORIC-644]
MAWLWDRTPKETERSQRKMVSMPVKMRSGDGWQDILIVNVSESGLLLKAEITPALGDCVEIRHRSLSIRGEVVRTAHRRFAIHAFEPIDLDTLLAKAAIRVRSDGRFLAPVEGDPWHWRRNR